MSGRESDSCKLSASINGRAALVADGVDQFVHGYGLMLLRGEPLPAKAAGELAKILRDCRDLSSMAAKLRESLTPL